MEPSGVGRTRSFGIGGHRDPGRPGLLSLASCSLPDAWQIGVDPTILRSAGQPGQPADGPIGRTAARTTRIGRVPVERQRARIRLSGIPVISCLGQGPILGG